jgi:hypothetical protein
MTTRIKRRAPKRKPNYGAMKFLHHIVTMCVRAQGLADCCRMTEKTAVNHVMRLIELRYVKVEMEGDYEDQDAELRFRLVPVIHDGEDVVMVPLDPEDVTAAVEDLGPAAPAMSEPRVLLVTLSERTSAKGTKYLS